MIGLQSGEDTPNADVTLVPVPVATLPVSKVPATVESTRVWTAAELASCEFIPGSRMSPCEVALTLARLEPLPEFTAEEQRRWNEYEATLEQLDGLLKSTFEDEKVTLEEAMVLCNWPLESVYEVMQEGEEFARERGMLGWEADFLRARGRINQLYADCNS